MADDNDTALLGLGAVGVAVVGAVAAWVLSRDDSSSTHPTPNDEQQLTDPYMAQQHEASLTNPETDTGTDDPHYSEDTGTFNSRSEMIEYGLNTNFDSVVASARRQ